MVRCRDPNALLVLTLAGALCALAHSDTAPNARTVATPPANSALDGELFYQLLLGELSAQGGDAGAAYALMLDAARKTDDRAAVPARRRHRAAGAYRANRHCRPRGPGDRPSPARSEANRYVLQILIGLNRLADTVEPLKREIALADATERSVLHQPAAALFRACHRQEARGRR